MFEEPWEKNPANFIEEERMLCRLYRTLNLLDRLEDAALDGWPRPRLAADLRGTHRILSHMVCAIESQLYRPQRLKSWMTKYYLDKRPPLRLPLLVHLLAVSRKGCTEVLRVHDATSRDEGEGEQCLCVICDYCFVLRWALGKARRLLSAALPGVRPTKGVRP